MKLREKAFLGGLSFLMGISCCNSDIEKTAKKLDPTTIATKESVDSTITKGNLNQKVRETTELKKGISRRPNPEEFKKKICEDIPIHPVCWNVLCIISKSNLKLLLKSTDRRDPGRVRLIVAIEDEIDKTNCDNFRGWLNSPSAKEFWNSDADNLFEYAIYNY